VGHNFGFTAEADTLSVGGTGAGVTGSGLGVATTGGSSAAGCNGDSSGATSRVVIGSDDCGGTSGLLT
jgi:hypothetical protein